MSRIRVLGAEMKSIQGVARSLRRTLRPAAREVALNCARLSQHLFKRRDMAVQLGKYGKKVYSQNDEDGIIEYLFCRIEPTSQFFVEIGVSPRWRNGRRVDIHEFGLECNCRLLAERGWKGLMIDGKQYPPPFNVKSEFITAENINLILSKYGAPPEFDLFSLDVDGNDYWIWKALTYHPRVVVIEYNPSLAAGESKTIRYDPQFSWASNGCTKYYGASLLALKKLGDAKGYTLVYANGVNAFFVKSVLVPNKDDYVYGRLYRYRNVHAALKGDEEWVDV
jgi:hypothetical protein